MEWAAVVLTGGTGRRLGAVDKARLRLEGRTLLERALAAAAGAAETVVVGDEVPTSRPVRFAREDPPGSGPAAGLLCGARSLAAYEVIVALAVDMPLVTSATLERLLGALREDVDGAVLDDGRPQPLCAAYRREALLAAAPAQTAGLSVRRLVAGLRLAGVATLGGEARDVDTREDVEDLGVEGLPRADGGESVGP